MKTDYDYYLLGCEVKGFQPLSEWRFWVIYGAFQSGRLGQPSDLLNLSPENARLRKRRYRGVMISVLVTRGKVIHKGQQWAMSQAQRS